MIVILQAFVFIGNVIPLQALSKEGYNLVNYDNLQEIANNVKVSEISIMNTEPILAIYIFDLDKLTSNDTSTANNEKNELIKELVDTGKLTQDEAEEIMTKVMNKGTDKKNMTGELNDYNVTNNVPQVPEANVTNNVPQVPEANVTNNVPQVPEANVTNNVPEERNLGHVKLELIIKQNPIAPGQEQTVTLIASDPVTGDPIDKIFIHLTIKDSSGNIVKDYVDNDGKLSPTFVISDGEAGTFTVLGTASQAGVVSSKSLTFEVQ